MLTVLITGTRRFKPGPHTATAALIREIVQKLPKGTTVIAGHANGIDKFFEEEARKRSDLNVHPVPADWDKHGPSAGPKRNFLMVDLLMVYRDHDYSTLVLAFPDDESIGTIGCLKRAEEKGFKVRSFPL